MPSRHERLARLADRGDDPHAVGDGPHVVDAEKVGAGDEAPHETGDRAGIAFDRHGEAEHVADHRLARAQEIGSSTGRS